jgi:hypothetical protein
MKKVVILMFAVLIISFASAEIVLHNEPNEFYNLGDTVSLPLTIKATSDVSGMFSMDLICEGHTINFYKNGVNLLTGEEKQLDPSIILTKEMINELKGICKVKGTFRGDYITTNDFTISDAITITLKDYEVELEPGNFLVIKGDALKEGGNVVEGFVDLEVVLTNSSDSLSQSKTVSGGFFSLNLSLPENLKAGVYLIKLNVYEKDNNQETTNKGFTNYNIAVKQIPRSLEIVLENNQINPGEIVLIKTILHDQTGESMPSTSIISIKDSEGKILEQVEKSTDETLEYSIAYNEAPAEWSIYAVSNKISTESNFEILENKDVEISLVNGSLKISNIGNVVYNDSIVVKVGEKEIKMNVLLDIDETKEYKLTAPEGDYSIEVVSNEGSEFSGQTYLTGRAINVKEASSKAMRSPVVWIFIFLVLGAIAYMIFRKGLKKAFYGRFNFKKKGKTPKIIEPHKKTSPNFSIINPKNKSEMSLSIKGDKQGVSILCLKLKNFSEIEKDKTNSKETLQKIVGVAEAEKAYTYQSNESIFFIWAPLFTKTFKNEMVAINTSKKIESLLSHHNRLFKQKINYGLSLNYGEIIAKADDKKLVFMSFGNSIAKTKKIAQESEREILLGKEINERLGSDVKTSKKRAGDFYSISEIKEKDKHSKFIDNFLKKNFKN